MTTPKSGNMDVRRIDAPGRRGYTAALMSARDLLAGFAKSVLVHRHAFIESAERTVAIG